MSDEERSRARARILGLSRSAKRPRRALIDVVGLRDPVGATWRLTARPLDSTHILCVAISEAAREIMGEAQEARAEAERASEAKTAFLARISHEIRTPISAIMGFAEVMMEERFGPLGSERYKEYLKDVHSSGAHVLSLVNDLLDLSKIEAGKLDLVVERLDVNAVIEECVSIMQNEASRERVIIRMSLAPRAPRIAADERSLRQILLNLLSNAIKFNEPGGQVIVSSAPTERRPCSRACEGHGHRHVDGRDRARARAVPSGEKLAAGAGHGTGSPRDEGAHRGQSRELHDPQPQEGRHAGGDRLPRRRLGRRRGVSRIEARAEAASSLS